MTSRRPMTRTYSGNGRTSSFSEEEGSSSNGRSESRNTYLSNVRPENSYSRYSHYRPTRSTLCSVMAQLTEDIQPSFETTLKSKAVSENCNVKFTCVVSGYPAPQLKWYKDDMEIDRYCGLPKYEIRHNGKTHTLHIYNCTLDDAAIYQVSASNSKGIVSCSGVLEVGTMNEYKIHQRFFAKLKQKAEKKKHDLEVQKKGEEKENVQKEKQQNSPERPPRKRHVPPPEVKPVVKEPEAVEQLGAAAEPNGVSPDAKEKEPVTTKDSDQDKEILTSEATKKMKISNGVDVSNSSRSHLMGNGGENCYDGGISLAQFLSETLQAPEEKQPSTRGEKPKDMDVPVVSASKEKDREQERMRKEREEQEKAQQEEHEMEKRREEELTIEGEKGKERSLAKLHTVAHTKHGSEAKHHSKTHKDHDHHNIQASISSMLHSVKDFLFGKSKKDFHDHIDHKERESDHSSATTQPPELEMPPSFQLQLDHNQEFKPPVEDITPMETDKSKEPSETLGAKQSVSLESHEHKHEGVIDLPEPHKMPPESMEESSGQSVTEAGDAEEAMEASAGANSCSPGEEMSLSGLQLLPEVADSQVADKKVAVLQQAADHLVVPPQPNNQTEKDDEKYTSMVPQTQAPSEEDSSSTHTLTSVEEGWAPPHGLISAADSHRLGEETAESSPEEEMDVIDMAKEGEPDTEEGRSSNRLCEEGKAEVKSNTEPHSDISRCEITELTASSVEERIQACEYKTPDQVLLPTYNVQGGSMKEETEHVSLVQEMNVGFPPTVAPQKETGDLKIEQECASSTEDIECLHSDIGSREDGSELSDVLISTVEKDLCKDLKTQEGVISDGESTEAADESLVRKEKEDPMTVEFDESKSFSETQNQESISAVVEEPMDIIQQDGNETHSCLSSENIPQIQISPVEDTPDVTPPVPDVTPPVPDVTPTVPDVTPPVSDVNPIENFVIPKIEILEPELKECTLPLTILASKKQESESVILQKHDAARVSAVVIRDQSVADSPSMLPTQKGMQNEYDLSPSMKVKEVSKSEITEGEQPLVKSNEQLPQIDFGSIPLISVSCTDDKEEDAHVSSRIAPTLPPFKTVPSFVVPPISVTCHESDSAFRLASDSTETETSAATQRGTKQNAEYNVPVKPEKSRKQNLEETAGRSLKESVPSVLCDAHITKGGDSGPSFSKTTEDNIVPEILKTKPLKEAKTDNSISAEDLRNRSSVDRLCSKPPTHPSLSPASLRKFMSKAAPETDNEAVATVPVITVGDRQSDKPDDDLSGGSTPTSSLSCESSPRLKRRDSLSLIRSATPEELASGARRKIFIPKPKEDGEAAVVGALDTQIKKESPYMSPSQARRAALLQAPQGQNTPPMERRSPLLSRRKVTLEVPKVVEEPPKEEPVSPKQEEKPAEKKHDPLKAPQVIRKIRGEPFPDASGHLKLWCQFFNVLSDSTIKWYRDEEEILEVKRSGGDESQVALAIVLASGQDCGVYGCSISNEYGTDITDFLLSVDILSEILLRDDLEVGEEIEMTPMLFTKGLGDSGTWGDKYFGRIMTEKAHMGEGCAHKASRAKVIYGLDPIFESGSGCIMKVKNPIPYGTKQESNLAERNGEITKQECKIQNMIREYCKIFAAEARVIENFGCSLEVIPKYLMYRPANSVPYATVETDLQGAFLQYCIMDPKGRLTTQTVSELEQKCCTFQHWIHQWTHGNLLVTRLEGVETKMTNVRVVTKSKGYQGLTDNGSPDVVEQFVTHHQCNYYCGLLGLKPLKTMDSLQQPSKIKGSRSPLLNRKLGSSSPQLQKKGQSPQMFRKANSSPKVTRKVQESEDNNSGVKPAENADALEMR